MLQLELMEDAVQNVGRKLQICCSESCIVQSYNHLHDLSTREALSIVTQLLNDFLGDALHADELLASVN